MGTKKKEENERKVGQKVIKENEKFGRMKKEKIKEGIYYRTVRK